jgi:hypothetical protein
MTPNKTLEHNTAPAFGFGGRLWWQCGLRAHYVVVGAVWLSFSFNNFMVFSMTSSASKMRCLVSSTAFSSAPRNAK